MIERTIAEMPPRDFKSFEEFWPYYVAEHSKPQTRLFHAAGTTASMACLLALAAAGKWKYLPLSLVPGYAAAWLSHFLIEKNRPATFDHPLWSFMGDYKMLALMLSGKMDAEVERVGNRTGSDRNLPLNS